MIVQCIFTRQPDTTFSSFYNINDGVQVDILKKLFLFSIRSYQVVLSPLLPQSCRFTPTCSQYAIDAISQFGPGRGIYMAIRRILRCHPFNRGGYDPVTDVFTHKI